jgi:hypothetical protein
VMGFFKGLKNNLPGAGFELQSWSLPPEQLGL